MCGLSGNKNNKTDVRQRSIREKTKKIGSYLLYSVIGLHSTVGI